ncbi:nucleotidyltransferase domain-containing protein [Bosea sp. (in: a-proteobacteria)]|uniref:nucleotidyltransferase family protein n=1 Tax=Bosea sp. (in: a-proteobacteria) TaxID=1871050 RepID=UPI0012277613|nr:nucleotidyltransferase domain-containing protein [Bosea sp. (in: a-proteobacteria)]TAJ34714.1 MAG: DNA polymerase III subunit beta [Bosea sp. (in: a-proteobacteria)]
MAGFEIARRADAARARGAEAAFLFDSTARDEATDGSDIDVFIDVFPGRKFSLIDLAAMHALLADELGIAIELTTRKSLHPTISLPSGRRSPGPVSAPSAV